eukprot:156354-Chlamydomonas_euryale.AAC.1
MEVPQVWTSVYGGAQPHTSRGPEAYGEAWLSVGTEVPQVRTSVCGGAQPHTEVHTTTADRGGDRRLGEASAAMWLQVYGHGARVCRSAPSVFVFDRAVGRKRCIHFASASIAVQPSPRGHPAFSPRMDPPAHLPVPSLCPLVNPHTRSLTHTPSHTPTQPLNH